MNPSLLISMNREVSNFITYIYIINHFEVVNNKKNCSSYQSVRHGDIEALLIFYLIIPNSIYMLPFKNKHLTPSAFYTYTVA